ncbi:hypothetical protein LINGRAHAP2_LOCUS28001 [Linum grandiflorum]
MSVLGVCNPNMEFISCLDGWEGSAHDTRVLLDALTRPNGFKVRKANLLTNTNLNFNKNTTKIMVLNLNFKFHIKCCSELAFM